MFEDFKISDSDEHMRMFRELIDDDQGGQRDLGALLFNLYSEGNPHVRFAVGQGILKITGNKIEPAAADLASLFAHLDHHMDQLPSDEVLRPVIYVKNSVGDTEFISNTSKPAERVGRRLNITEYELPTPLYNNGLAVGLATLQPGQFFYHDLFHFIDWMKRPILMKTLRNYYRVKEAAKDPLSENQRSRLVMVEFMTNEFFFTPNYANEGAIHQHLARIGIGSLGEVSRLKEMSAKEIQIIAKHILKQPTHFYFDSSGGGAVDGFYLDVLLDTTNLKTFLQNLDRQQKPESFNDQDWLTINDFPGMYASLKLLLQNNTPDQVSTDQQRRVLAKFITRLLLGLKQPMSATQVFADLTQVWENPKNGFDAFFKTSASAKYFQAVYKDSPHHQRLWAAPEGH